MTPGNKWFAILANESLETSQRLSSLTPSTRRPQRPFECCARKFLLGKGASLGFSALTLLTLAGCGVHRVVTMAPATAPATAAPTVPPTDASDHTPGPASGQIPGLRCHVVQDKAKPGAIRLDTHQC